MPLPLAHFVHNLCYAILSNAVLIWMIMLCYATPILRPNKIVVSTTLCILGRSPIKVASGSLFSSSTWSTRLKMQPSSDATSVFKDIGCGEYVEHTIFLVSLVFSSLGFSNILKTTPTSLSSINFLLSNIHGEVHYHVFNGGHWVVCDFSSIFSYVFS